MDEYRIVCICFFFFSVLILFKTKIEGSQQENSSNKLKMLNKAVS